MNLLIYTQDICRPLGVPPILDGEKAHFVLDPFIKGDGCRFFNPVWWVLRLTPKPPPSATDSDFRLVAAVDFGASADNNAPSSSR
jgi:hypothetical protein